MPRSSSAPLPRLIRGSVIAHQRRCGRPTCHCADGESLHASTVLSYSQGGRTRFVMLPADAVAAVRAATERYRHRRAALEEQGDQGLRDLVATLASGARRR